MAPPQFIAAIDQGTTSTRCILFHQNGTIASVGQFEHKQIFPQKGWVEHNPMEIWDNTRLAQAEALAKADASPESIVALGITNQRETTLVWDKRTGRPVYNAIVWQDTRTAAVAKEIAGDEGPDRFRSKTGLILNAYPAATKLKWILDNVEGAREDAEAGHLLFGTMDTWLIWNLTGGAWGDNNEPALHVTDVTNASRTLLMDLETLRWDEDICKELDIPMQMLPEIRPSSGDFRHVRGRDALANVPIRGVMGDQQAAMFGQACYDPGDAKNTYGTGLFLLLNTGEEPKFSEHGMLTTVCYQVEGQKPVYALEGSVAVGGSLIQWLRDNLGIIKSAPEVETMAKKVPDNGGVYIVPAFSGLFAPRWEPSARGVFCGLTRFANKNHIARAAIEATAFQTREIVEAMIADSGMPLNNLKVDGGMVMNELLMQFQADILDTEVIRPKVIETTALGVAYAAGLSMGYWNDLSELKDQWAEDKTWTPDMDGSTRDALLKDWNKAVERSYNWED